MMNEYVWYTYDIKYIPYMDAFELRIFRNTKECISIEYIGIFSDEWNAKLYLICYEEAYL